MSNLVAEPVPALVNKTFRANLVWPTSGEVTTMTVMWLRNGGVVTSQTVQPGVYVVERLIPVAEGDVICVRVYATGPAGKSATYEECVTVAGLPLIPGDPDVTVEAL